jgi:nucleotide-binding universal stress UspA family protein
MATARRHDRCVGIREEEENAMTATANRSKGGRIVLVVGLELEDLDGTSEHLLSTVKELTRGTEQAEVHVVHVVAPETFNERLTEPVMSPGVAERSRVQVAQWEIERLCRAVIVGGGVRVFMHTPAGQPVPALARLAHDLGADAIVVEAHEHHTGARRLFHRSVAAGLARSATCSVLTVRAQHPVAATG